MLFYVMNNVKVNPLLLDLVSEHLPQGRYVICVDQMVSQLEIAY